MSKTILMEVDGWTPIIDAVVADTSLMSAVVFGRMWRFCQMEDNVCKASLQKISEGIGIDRATVQRHADKLCDTGYLKDLTPNLRNKPHIYVDTGKAGIKSTLSATVAQSNVTVAEDNTGVAQSNVAVAESQLNKVLKKESKKPIKIKADKPPTPPEVILYREVTGKYPKSVVYEEVVSAIQKVSARLFRPCVADDLRPFFRLWMTKSNNEYNMSVWLLEWAVSGKTQTGNQKPPTNLPKGIQAGIDFLNAHGVSDNG